MLWVWMTIGCLDSSSNSGFYADQGPDFGALLGKEVSVDPYSGKIWAARTQMDPALLVELGSLLEQEELADEDWVRLEEVLVTLEDTKEEFVYTVDPAQGYRADQVGRFVGHADPRAYFGVAGPVLGSHPVDSSGRAESDRYLLRGLETGQQRFSEALQPSPTGIWFLTEQRGAQHLLSATLELELVLNLEQVAWAPSGALYAFENGTLRLFEPRSQRELRSVTARNLDPDLALVSVLDLDPNEDFALLRTRKGERDSAALLELSTGALQELPSAYQGARFTQGGDLFVLDGQRFRMRSAIGIEQSWSLPFGSAWVDSQARWLVYSDGEGFGVQVLGTDQHWAFSGALERVIVSGPVGRDS